MTPLSFNLGSTVHLQDCRSPPDTAPATVYRLEYNQSSDPTQSNKSGANELRLDATSPFLRFAEPLGYVPEQDIRQRAIVVVLL